MLLPLISLLLRLLLPLLLLRSSSSCCCWDDWRGCCCPRSLVVFLGQRLLLLLEWSSAAVGGCADRSIVGPAVAAVVGSDRPVLWVLLGSCWCCLVHPLSLLLRRRLLVLLRSLLLSLLLRRRCYHCLRQPLSLSLSSVYHGRGALRLAWPLTCRYVVGLLMLLLLLPCCPAGGVRLVGR